MQLTEIQEDTFLRPQSHIFYYYYFSLHACLRQTSLTASVVFGIKYTLLSLYPSG